MLFSSFLDTNAKMIFVGDISVRYSRQRIFIYTKLSNGVVQQPNTGGRESISSCTLTQAGFEPANLDFDT